MGSMGLGGMATYTTFGDRCTEMVYLNLRLMLDVHLVLWVSEVCSLMIYSLLWMHGYHV